jgi:hypothetical protein
MTTAVTHWFHGDLVTAGLTYPLETLFALFISVGFIWGWKEVVRPQGHWPRLLSAITHALATHECRYMRGSAR